MTSMIPEERPERGQDRNEESRRGSKQEKGRYLAEALGMPRVKSYYQLILAEADVIKL